MASPFDNPPPPAPAESPAANLTFAVVLITAAPVAQAAEAGGAFTKIDGRECLLRSVELFTNRDGVKTIVVAVSQDMLDEAKRKFGGHFGLSGVKLVGAGVRWMEQVAAASAKIPDDVTHVIVHDAARPVVPYTDLDRLAECAAQNDAVLLTTPVRATLVEVDGAGHPLHYHTAREFVQLVTPQIFTRARFMKMAETQQEVPASEVTLEKGSPINIRVGGPGDDRLARAMLSCLPKPKVKPPSSPFEEAQW
jgi:2-C-methyl-D-erythritol 4-phosphate cytidylyltransferase